MFSITLLNTTKKSEGKATSSQSTIQLLSKIGLIVVAIVLILAAWNNLTPVVILLGVILSAAGIAKFWSRYSLSHVYYERLLSEQRAFPGEEVELIVRVSNRKLLPLAWLEINDGLPLQLPAVNLTSGELSEGTLKNSISLLWYRRASWRYHLRCMQRGYYALGPVTLHSGDIFGFYPRSVVSVEVSRLIVYPKIFPLAGLDLPPIQPLGEMKASYRIFQDPTRAIGVRSYIPGDPFKHIHWKASARHQHLQVKVFEPSTTLQAILWLAVDSFDSGEQGDGVEDFELAVSMMASLANHFIEHGYPVGMFANTCLPGSDMSIRVLPGVSHDHLINILEILAKVTLSSIEPLETLLSQERSNMPWGATLIFVASKVSETLSATLDSLRGSGRRVVLLKVGKRPIGGANYKYKVYEIKAIGDLTSRGAALALEKISGRQSGAGKSSMSLLY